MTEQEAKNKWCPMVRVAGPVGSYNQPAEGGASANGNTRCRGSSCMMWRIALDFNPIQGYCGLAGREGAI